LIRHLLIIFSDPIFCHLLQFSIATIHFLKFLTATMSSTIKPTDPPILSNRATLLTDELGELENSDRAAKLTDKKSCFDRLKYHLEVLQTHPYIFVLSFLVFSALCACGLLIIFFFAKQEANELRDEALDLAIETGDFFCKWSLLSSCPTSIARLTNCN
jgi:hypothetical protein